MSYSGQFYGSQPDDDARSRNGDDDVQDAEVVGETAGPDRAADEDAIVVNLDGGGDGRKAAGERPDRPAGEPEKGTFLATRAVRQLGWWITALLPFIVVATRLIATPRQAGTQWFFVFITLPVFYVIHTGAMVGTQLATVGKRLTRRAMAGAIIATTAGVAAFYAFSPYLADHEDALPASYDALAFIGFLLYVAGFIFWIHEMKRAAQRIPDILAAE